MRFQVIHDGAPASKSRWPLEDAHLIGSDTIALRADTEFDAAVGEIVCTHREPDSAALVIQHDAGEMGLLTLQTTCLPEREAPYLLTLELARHRMMLCLSKAEEWGLLDLPADHPAMRSIVEARDLFVEALCAYVPGGQASSNAEADRLAQRSLERSLDASEELALAEGDQGLRERVQAGQFPRFPLGHGLRFGPAPPTHREHDDHAGFPAHNKHLLACDFVQLPIPWRELVPSEGEYRWEALDAWVEWSVHHRKPLLLGPLLSFEPSHLPEWAFIFEHDYDTLRDVIFEHVDTVLKRYAKRVRGWIACSGLHSNEHFALTYDQIMDLTRTVVLQVKQHEPQATALVELRQPWGEYYATNPRSIPPIAYAELINEAALDFDGFGLKLVLPAPMRGKSARDLMQVSQLIDRVAAMGKAVYIACGTPSEPITPMMVADPKRDEPVDIRCGYWRREATPALQGRWLQAMLQVSLGKPMVDAVMWQELFDYPAMAVPLTGLLDERGEPKPAMERWAEFRDRLSDSVAVDDSDDVLIEGDDGDEIEIIESGF